MRGARDFGAACHLLDGVYRLLVLITTNQEVALRKVEGGWDAKKAVLIARIADARTAARHSPTLRATAAPFSLLELSLSSCEVTLTALRDPLAPNKAMGALARVGKGLLTSVLERKIDASLFDVSGSESARVAHVPLFGARASTVSHL